MARHELQTDSTSLALLASGRKDLEVRPKYPTLEDFVRKNEPSIKKGDDVIFNGILACRVIAVREYPNFPAAVDHEKYTRILPGRRKIATLRHLQRTCSAEREEQGVLVYELALV